MHWMNQNAQISPEHISYYALGCKFSTKATKSAKIPQSRTLESTLMLYSKIHSKSFPVSGEEDF